MKNKKLATMVASLALVGAIGMGATLAYLSDTSTTLTNVFTVGNGYVEDDELKVALWIDEKDIDGKTAGEKTTTINNEVRTLDGNTYEKVIAGSALTKDPIVRLSAKSVKSHIVINVKGLDALVAKGLTFTGFSEKWVKINANGQVIDGDKTLDGIYKYEDVLAPTDTAFASTEAFFTNVTAADDFNADGTITSLEDVTIKACALQAVKYDNGVETPIAFDAANFPAGFTTN